jgi:hypothetical protein
MTAGRREVFTVRRRVRAGVIIIGAHDAVIVDKDKNKCNVRAAAMVLGKRLEAMIYEREARHNLLNPSRGHSSQTRTDEYQTHLCGLYK